MVLVLKLKPEIHSHLKGEKASVDVHQWYLSHFLSLPKAQEVLEMIVTVHFHMNGQSSGCFPFVLALQS